MLKITVIDRAYRTLQFVIAEQEKRQWNIFFCTSAVFAGQLLWISTKNNRTLDIAEILLLTPQYDSINKCQTRTNTAEMQTVQLQECDDWLIRWLIDWLIACFFSGQLLFFISIIFISAMQLKAMSLWPYLLHVCTCYASVTPGTLLHCCTPQTDSRRHFNCNAVCWSISVTNSHVISRRAIMFVDWSVSGDG